MKRTFGLAIALIIALGCGSIGLAATPKKAKAEATVPIAATAPAATPAKQTNRKHARRHRHAKTARAKQSRTTPANAPTKK